MYSKFSNFSFLLLIFCLFSVADAAAPTNDNLANALVISGATGTTNGTTVDATREIGEFSHTFSSQTFVYRTVWFRWTATQTKPVVFDVSSASNGFDPALAVYKGDNFPLSSVTRNNDTSGNLPRVEFKAEIGVTYQIVVGFYNDANSQGGSFTLNWLQNNNPTNDNFANARILENAQTGSVAVTNQNATHEPNEPSHLSLNDKSIWFNFTNPTANDYSVTFKTRDSFDPSLNTTLAVYTGASLQALTPVVKNDNYDATLKSNVTFLAKAGVTYRIALDNAVGSQPGDIILSWDITKVGYSTDFGTRFPATGEVYYNISTDITVYRPSNGAWYWLDSGNNAFHSFQFGQNGDTPVPADFDGDGRTDFAVTRNIGGNKYWYISKSFDGSFQGVQWGLSDDRAVPGDYDFDGRMDIAVFRPSNGFWYILRSSDGNLMAKQFGAIGDIPAQGDFKGTGGGTDIAVFRPSNGTWYISNGNATISNQFGANGDKPVVADYDSDGKSDIAVYRPSNGTWYYIQSANNQFKAVQWGAIDDVPQPGDYNANSNNPADFTVFRPSNQTWYVLKSEGTVTQIQQFGAPGDIPASSLTALFQ
jgi:hypothetical protein